MVLRFGEEDFKRDSRLARAYPKLQTYKFIAWVLGLPERTVQAIPPASAVGPRSGCARWPTRGGVSDRHQKRGNLQRAKYQHRPRRLTEKQIDWLCKPKQIQDWRSFTLEERC